MAPRNSVHSSRAPALAFVLAALCAPILHAAEKKAAAPLQSPAPAPKTPILTPAQLQECLAQKDKLAKDTDAALKTKAEITADKAEIDRTGAALNEQATTLDRTKADAVADYNARVLERNGRIDAYQAKATAYNADAETLLTAKAGYEKACANRRYDDRDLSDIQRKK